MKLKIEKSDLLAGISTAIKAAGSKNGNWPILECVLLDATESGLRLTCNNLELSIQTAFLDAEVECPGSAAVEARRLADIIKKLPGGRAIITANENNTLSISCERTRFDILTVDAGEFPAMPDVERGAATAVSAAILKDMIRRTVFAVGYDANKPALTGELIEFSGDRVNIVAVDGFRAAHCFWKAGRCYSGRKAIVSGDTMNEITKLLTGSGDALIYFADRHVVFELDSCLVVSRTPDGDYMDYGPLFAGTFSTSVKLNRAELLAAAERAALAASDGAVNAPVKLDIGGGTVAVSVKTEKTAVYDEIYAETDGKELAIAFNPRYITDALKAFDSGEIIMEFNGPLRPCVMRPVSEECCRQLVMPLRLI